jgi:hypothetical protein
MNLKVAIARGVVSIENLEPGSVFVHAGQIAVKMNQERFSFEPCNCVVIGTGDNLYDSTTDAETFNQTMVTRVLLYEDQGEGTE